MKTIFTHWQLNKCHAILKSFSALLLIALLFFSSQTFGQDISQIRNGSASDPSKNFFSTFPNPDWVNGNAGASNAHYVEGMSIGYRSLLTSVTAGVCYEYVIEYDTYHGAMAIDYLTHFQRLEPHGPFGHPAEVIDPRIFKSGNKEYLIGLVSTNTFPIPPPAASGITSGSTLNISGQPTASYNALPASERLMTIYNGTINSITYENQQSIAISGNANTSSSIRIRFTAAKDSVVLAWGGHIASRLDWGSSSTTGVPLSAAGISGSPYHMRQLSMNTCSGTNIPIGNQDRSLSAAAVVPPPACPSVPSQSKCLGSTSFTFAIASPQAGATYTWSFGTNTAGAAFSGGTNTGNSVTIVPSATAFTAGSFTLNITALLNGISQVCTGVATGTVVKVVATASANPTTIDLTSAAHSTTLTADIAGSSTFTLNTDYTYAWSIVTPGTLGTLTNSTSRIASYTANKLDPTSITFSVTATLSKTGQPVCTSDATVTVTLTGTGACSVSPQSAVCQGTETTHNGSPDPKSTNATYVWSLEANGGGGTTTSTMNLVATPNGGVQMKVNTVGSYRIVLTQTYANSAFNTSCYQDVTVVPTPSVSAIYNPPGCSDQSFTIDVPNSVIGSSYKVTQGAESTPTYTLTKPGTGGTLNFSGLALGGGFLVRVTTGTATCTATATCASSSSSCASSASTPVISAVKAPELYKIVLESGTKVNATPNPFTQNIKFDLVSAVSGYGSLELYNSIGQKLGIVYQGYIQAGRPLMREYSITKGSEGTVVYVFKVGDQKVTGKLLRLKF